MSRVSDKVCVDPGGIVHALKGYKHQFTVCGWQRIWRESHNGIWHNLRWKLVRDRHVTCIACIAWSGKSGWPDMQTPYKYTS